MAQRAARKVFSRSLAYSTALLNQQLATSTGLEAVESYLSKA